MDENDLPPLQIPPEEESGSSDLGKMFGALVWIALFGAIAGAMVWAAMRWMQ